MSAKIKQAPGPKPSPASLRTIAPWTEMLMLSVVLLVGFFTYGPALNNGFTFWDDHIYVLQNPFLRNLSFSGVMAMFNTFWQGNYHPITLLSLALDYSHAGDKASTYILVNILLHLSNTILLFFLLRTFITGFWISLLLALLFAVHPMHVESVAWIAARKDVLMGFFFLASWLSYVLYLIQKKTYLYFLSLFLFALSLLSKGMAVPLALVILATDKYWGRKLLSPRLILEKIPYVLLASIFAYVAVKAQQTNALVLSHHHENTIERIALAGIALAQYVLKLILPYSLSAYYPYPSTTNLFFGLFTLIALGILIYFFLNSRKPQLPVFGCVVFILLLIPVLQFIPVGDALIAERYTYLSSAGILMVIGYVGTILYSLHKKVFIGFLLVMLGYSAWLAQFTFTRCSVWHDGISLWTDVIKQFPKTELAYQNRGSVHFQKSHFKEAQSDYDFALALDSMNAVNHFNRGLLFFTQESYYKANTDFENSVRLRPESSEYNYYLGYTELLVGKLNKSETTLSSAISLDSLNGNAYRLRGLSRFDKKNYTEAMNDYNKAISLNPQDADAFGKRGVLKFELNDKEGACADWHQVRQLGSKNADQAISMYCEKK